MKNYPIQKPKNSILARQLFIQDLLVFKKII
jgi:hypothetical protein